jgi:hypothetical protein
MKPFSHSIQRHLLQAIVILLVVGTEGAFADDFRNLDFESAVIQTAPPNYVPWDADNPIDAAAALPFWTAHEDSMIATAVWGHASALDETSVALVTANDYYSPIQGMYGILLSAVANAIPPYFRTSSISQVGYVPLGTRSIHFLLRSPPNAGVVKAVPAVSINGVTINVLPYSTDGDIITMVGDLSAFAGSTAELSILCAGTPGGQPSTMENIFELDAITFSQIPLPEPSTLTLLCMGALGLLVLAWRHVRRID